MGRRRVSDREIANQSAGRISPPGADFSGAELRRALLRTYRKHDTWPKSQVDAERVGIARSQIAGIHVKVPLPTSKGEGNVRNSGITRFVHLFNRAANLTRHGQLAALGIIEEALRPDRDWLTIGVAHLELHWDGAARLALVNAADRRH